jgi:CubicO group peptidase (beta-lactamase class C family)
MGGISGNAGLFSNVKEITVFMQMMMNGGVYIVNGKSVKIFEESTVELFTTRVDGLPYKNSRALGWDTVPQSYPNACGTKLSPHSFGHTGYTGTTIWADKDR